MASPATSCIQTEHKTNNTLIDNAMIDTIESPYIHAATADNFSSLVLDNSKLGPVLVNFWSKKAGPCLRLYPVLDKMIHHYAGRVLLINIDTESDVAIPREYGITSVPTLKLFRNGQVVETWHGYQSEEDLTRVLDIYVSRDSDQILPKAIQLYTEGDTTEAYEMIAEAIVNDPVNPRLPLAMCKLLKHEARYAEAMQLIDSLPDDVRDKPEINQFKDMLSFYLDLDPTIELNALLSQIKTSPGDMAARQRIVAYYVTQQRFEDALNELVTIMDTEPGYNDNYVQKAMLKIINILGTEHALAVTFRPHLRRYAH